MASGGYKSHNPSSSNTTDFLEEWKAKREKMRAKMLANELLIAATGGGGGGECGGNDIVNKASSELNNNGNCNAAPTNNPVSAAPSINKGPANKKADEDPIVPSTVMQQKKVPGPVQDGVSAGNVQDESTPPVSQETHTKAKEKKSCSGPSARKGKGQIEKRKLREKRRSTGVVNIPSVESPDEYEDDEAGQKERKGDDVVTKQNTLQNESFSLDPSESYLPQETARTAGSNRYKSSNNAFDDDALNRYSRNDRTACNHLNRETSSSGNSGQDSALEKRIEELERDLAIERQEHSRLTKLMQDKEELIHKMKEEIDLLNRDLDDLEDENKQLKQENKTLLKVVGQLTR
ncbi:hypothetical protein XENTR_v10008591 [Xenopus tropicalis]|uniref:PRKC apoptosis WT1 regulator protein isoform X1 n=1 Tax=Xenopus tropicalis TaxID=8364 RepID=A0A8J1JDT5_XENTR|nr:PRKC apoptosis WT1 regulator protein isoform X1 [Xenopus tropicalis]XP_031754803.1 PRKC apoptosis WT1 regulator protein isoform X1 [Xenopus tropicalis]XP_031754804.1 PRKC apoptosis WT1 regulator protein isoform X1 [Xenopus tropicalis]XP_031754805.1 PRKC apoptosis WT1 regulator protein isoform X1 [Xenopus tropicalis]XP_031754806.1 PRKC apoptosis WT1 regulator protein isoform X1 [Xenopus tropicalis]XP_031754807.1 PRKC apoptosis WT1 regulator protein isoform X1 [Xenopus tropicalis]KAE8615712.